MKSEEIRPSAEISTVFSRPATPPICWAMKVPSATKIGKNRACGEPAATSVSTGTMSVSPTLTAV